MISARKNFFNVPGGVLIHLFNVPGGVLIHRDGS